MFIMITAKRHRGLFIILLCMFFLGSCSKGSVDIDDYASAIVGTWVVESTEPDTLLREDDCSEVVLSFSADGGFLLEVDGRITVRGDYSVVGEYAFTSWGEFKIQHLSSKKMVLRGVYYEEDFSSHEMTLTLKIKKN